MTDQLEVRLRSVLQSAALSTAPDSLRELLHDLPASAPLALRAWRPSAMLLAATVALLVAAASSIVFVGSRLLTRPVPSPTPLSSPSPTAFPSPTSLLAGYDVDVVIERESTAAEETVGGTVDLGIRRLRPFIAAVTCEGATEVTLEATNPSGPFPTGGELPPTGPALFSATVSCDGDGEHHEQSLASDVGAQLSLRAPAGASWRVEIGEYPDEFAEPPADFGTLTPTEGWSLVTDYTEFEVVTPFNRAALLISVPSDATRIGVQVWCAGPAQASITAGGRETRQQTVVCPTADAGRGSSLRSPAARNLSSWSRRMIRSGLGCWSSPTPPQRVSLRRQTC